MFTDANPARDRLTNLTRSDDDDYISHSYSLLRHCVLPSLYALKLLPGRPEQNFIDVHVVGLAHGEGNGARE